MRVRRALILAIMLASTSTTIAAQTGVVGGTVMRDSSGHALGDAQVAIPELNLSTRTNFNGEFRLDGVRPGRHALIFRHVGFAPFTDSVTVQAGHAIDQEWILTEVAVTLDSQVTVAAGVDMSNPNLREFEDRRKLGLGRFIDGADLRKVDNGRPLINYIASRIPGLTVYQPDSRSRPLDYYLSSGRGTISGKRYCPVTIYIDGTVYSTDDSADMSKLAADDFAGVEYYAGGASLPSRFNMTSKAGCGVLLLWRRYR
jgi:hypothetical protein